MKPHKTLIIGKLPFAYLLFLAIAFFPFSPAQAEFVFKDKNRSQVKQQIQLTEPNSPMYGTWKLTFSINGIVYESVLVMDGYYGATRTIYYDPSTRRTSSVDQQMILKSSAMGLILLGANPVYAGSNRKHPTYIPDNFLFQIRPDGSSLVVTCDSAKRCSDVYLETIR